MSAGVCRNGHPWTPENTYWRKDRPGDRRCRGCHRDTQKRMRLRDPERYNARRRTEEYRARERAKYDPAKRHAEWERRKERHPDLIKSKTTPCPGCDRPVPGLRKWCDDRCRAEWARAQKPRKSSTTPCAGCGSPAEGRRKWCDDRCRRRGRKYDPAKRHAQYLKLRADDDRYQAFLRAGRDRRRAPAVRERLRQYAAAYHRKNIVGMVGGVRLNRATAPAQLVAVAERIQETRALLKNLEESNK